MMQTTLMQLQEALLVCSPNEEDSFVVRLLNPAGEILLGQKAETLMGKDVEKLLGLETTALKRIISGHLVAHTTTGTYFHKQSGEQLYLELKIQPLEDEGQTVCAIWLKDGSNSLAQWERLKIFRTIYDNSQEGIMIFNERQTLEWVNKAFIDITGRDKAWVIGLCAIDLELALSDLGIWGRLHSLLNDAQPWQGEVWASPKGALRLFEVKMHVIKSDTAPHYVVVISDRTQYFQLVQEVDYLAYRDKLTGLYNLRYLMEDFDQDSRPKGLFYIDIDGFTKINDSFGHLHGDTVIKIVASRLQGNARTGEHVARVGGDKFALWAPKQAIQSMEVRGHQLLDIFRKPVMIDKQSIQLSVNVGFADNDKTEEAAMELLKAAELASKQAKRKGFNRLNAYDSNLADVIKAQYRLDRDLLAALERDEFYLKFQPVVRTHSGEVAGFEALIRWRHGELGEISPVEFIPIAEKNGAISAIGDWVLAETLSCLKTINELYQKPIYGAVNVSIRQLEQEDFVKRVRKLMDRYQIDGRYLEMEVTESVYMENLDAIFDNLKALNEMGIRIAIDDFGTGYSALSQLFRLDIGKIKIDKSFIDGLSKREESNRLTEAVTLIAKSLNLELVAEGVETEVQLEHLRRLNCDYIQGFLYSKPLSLGDFCRFLGIET